MRDGQTEGQVGEGTGEGHTVALYEAFFSFYLFAWFGDRVSLA